MAQIIENLRKLIQLQDLDSRLLVVKERLALIPEQEARIESDVAAAVGRRDQCNEELKQLTAQRRQFEQQMTEVREAVKRQETRLYQIRDNKGYTAMLHEIEHLKDRASEAEDKALDVLDLIDEAEKKLAKAERELRTQVERAESDRANLSRDKEELRSEVERLKKERAEKAQGVDPALLGQYERTRANKEDRVAIVRMEEDGICGGCSVVLPPQVVSDVAHHTKIIRCERCMRFLYNPDGLEKAESLPPTKDVGP